MLKNLVGKIWRGIPAGMRLWAIRLTNAHFTVTAGAVIFNEEGHVLILKHRFRAGSGWGLPGGFLKHGEQPLEALQRELREEIGVEIEDAEIFSSRSFKRPKQIEILFSGYVKGQVQPQSIEVDQFVWCAPDALPAGLSEDQKLLVKRAVEKRAV